MDYCARPKPKRHIRLSVVLWLALITLEMAAFQNCSQAKHSTYSASASNAVKAVYSEIAEKIVQPKCVACHNSGPFDFSTFESLLATGAIVPGQPDASSFYTDVESGSMPMNMPRLSSAEVQAIYAWIAAGAVKDSDASSPQPPPTPGAFSATAISGTQILLTWADTSDEQGFRIERSTSAAGPFAQILSAPANITSHQDSGLGAGTTYYYRLHAFNAAGDSGFISTSAATPAADAQAPSQLGATAVSASQINLAWNDNSSNEMNFKVERAENAAGPFTVIATLGANVRAYSNSGLATAKTYYYRVYATGPNGNTGNSNAASAVTFGTYAWFNAAIAQPLCLNCHSGNMLKGGYDVSSYSAVITRVIPGNSSGSKLYQDLESGSMPKGAAKLTSEQVTAVRLWIDSGAANN